MLNILLTMIGSIVLIVICFITIMKHVNTKILVLYSRIDELQHQIKALTYKFDESQDKDYKEI